MAHPVDDPILRSIQASNAALQRLTDLEVAGRTMMTFMSGHMHEIARMQPPADYFRDIYSDFVREFVQLDDEDFVIHHCLRVLFYHWRDELAQIRDGVIGRALERIDVALPVPGNPARPGRTPVAGYWYEDVLQKLATGALPAQREVLNPIMPAEECVLKGRRDLIWAAFLEWCGETWGRQIAPAWTLVREAIQMRRTADEQLGEQAVTATIEQHADAYRAACAEFQRLYDEWHSFHAETIEVHDPMYAAFLPAIVEFYSTFGDAVNEWVIKEPTKDEMYVEVACTVAQLQGDPLDVEIPTFRYWRSTPWTPECIRIGAPGLPPFSA